MVETLKLKEENNKKIKKNAKTRMAVHTHTHTHTLYCHLENKKEKLNINKNKDRTMQNIKDDIGLSYRALCRKTLHKHQREGHTNIYILVIFKKI